MQAWWIRVFSSAYGSLTAGADAVSVEAVPGSAANVAADPLPFVV